ncbi:hypothetical protein F5Y16DRAFT_335740 [Xylariaceae sp. FL0255]|nr:hypothetical protein F5Y16DRAFT_335740 [Xylariaceae sp. FL0255]
MEEVPTEPQGLYFQKEFITPAHEAELIHIFQHELTWPASKNPGGGGGARLSLHYGYTFDYKTFGVDPDIPYKPFPSWLEPLIPKTEGRPPEQVCLQWYPPGAGIPPHVDTHSAYDQLYALSLGSAVVMQFRRPVETLDPKSERSKGGETKQLDGGDDVERKKVDVDLPPRSMMQMSGDSRLHWEHGIKKRKNDTLADGTIRPRADRWSITYRWLREGGECECGNKRLCDTAQKKAGIEREYRWKNQAQDGEDNGKSQNQGDEYLERNGICRDDRGLGSQEEIAASDTSEKNTILSPS